MPSSRRTSTMDLRHQRILLVDDDSNSRQLTRVILEHEGLHDVREAADGQAALDSCKRIRPDVVVLDLEMPGMDGWSALPRLRKRLPGAALIVFSGAPDLDPSHLRALGATACISKASSSDEFVNRLRSALHEA